MKMEETKKKKQQKKQQKNKKTKKKQTKTKEKNKNKKLHYLRYNSSSIHCMFITRLPEKVKFSKKFKKKSCLW